MTDTEWNAWMEYHSTLHAMDRDKDFEMMSIWRDVFEGRGYGASELREASMHLATAQSKSYRSQHLECLLLRISGQRLATRRADQDARYESVSQCSLCSGCGIVIVPHLESVVDNEWVHPWYSAGVACSCAKGAVRIEKNQESIEKAREDMTKRNRMKPPPGLWTLAYYEGKNPDWQGQVKRKEAAQRREVLVRSATRDADDRLGPIFRRAIKKVVKGGRS